MLKISKLADYGILVLTHMAEAPSQRFSAPDLAAKTLLTLPTVSKILKILAKANILSSTRGTQGGYALAHEPEHVSMIDIITALDGTMALTDCATNKKDCRIKDSCSLQTNWQHINQKVTNTLTHISLADMLSPLPNTIEE